LIKAFRDDAASASKGKFGERGERPDVMIGSKTCADHPKFSHILLRECPPGAVDRRVNWLVC